MMAKLDLKGYGTDVAVIDLVALKPDKTISSISIYILLKTYKDERKLTEFPTPTMPNVAIRRP